MLNICIFPLVRKHAWRDKTLKDYLKEGTDTSWTHSCNIGDIDLIVAVSLVCLHKMDFLRETWPAHGLGFQIFLKLMTKYGTTFTYHIDRSRIVLKWIESDWKILQDGVPPESVLHPYSFQYIKTIFPTTTYHTISLHMIWILFLNRKRFPIQIFQHKQFG